MNLIVDIGNTRTKIALFEKNELVEKAILENGALGELSAAISEFPIEGAILSATGVDTEGVELDKRKMTTQKNFDPLSINARCG